MIACVVLHDEKYPKISVREIEGTKTLDEVKLEVLKSWLWTDNEIEEQADRVECFEIGDTDWELLRTINWRVPTEREVGSAKIHIMRAYVERNKIEVYKAFALVAD